MNLGRRLVGDTLLYGVALALARALAFALLPIYTRVLGAAQYGSYDLVLSLSRALGVPAVLGMDSGIALMLRSGTSQEQGRAISSALAAQLAWAGLLMLAVIALAPTLSRGLFGGPGHAGLLALGALLMIVQVANGFTVALAKWKREPGIFLLLSVGSVAVAAVVSIMLVLRGGGAQGALLGMVTGGALFIPIGLLVSLRHMARRVAVADMVRCARLGLPFAATTATELVFPLLLRLILLDLAGLEAVGVFGATNAICLGILLVNDAFATAWWPYALSAEGAARLGEDTARIMRLYAFFLVVLAAIVTLAAEPLIRIVLGSGAFGQAAHLVGPLVFAYWLKGIRQNANASLVISGRNWLRAVLNLVTVAVSLALAYGLTERWGLGGTAWGFAGGEAMGLLLQGVLMSRADTSHADMSATAIMGLAFVLLMIGEALLPAVPAGAQILERLLLGAGFVGALLLARAVRWGELRAVIAILPGIGGRVSAG